MAVDNEISALELEFNSNSPQSTVAGPPLRFAVGKLTRDAFNHVAQLLGYQGKQKDHALLVDRCMQQPSKVDDLTKGSSTSGAP